MTEASWDQYLANYLEEYSHIMMYANDTALLVAKKHITETHVDLAYRSTMWKAKKQHIHPEENKNHHQHPEHSQNSPIIALWVPSTLWPDSMETLLQQKPPTRFDSSPVNGTFAPCLAKMSASSFASWSLCRGTQTNAFCSFSPSPFRVSQKF